MSCRCQEHLNKRSTVILGTACRQQHGEATLACEIINTGFTNFHVVHRTTEARKFLLNIFCKQWIHCLKQSL